jgi:hypothetical protein
MQNLTTLTPPTTVDEQQFADQLAALAVATGRDLCGKCGGSAHRPCSSCKRTRARITELYDEDLPLRAIAAQVHLPAWRVRQILDEQRHVGKSADELERQANLDLLRPYLPDGLLKAFDADGTPDAEWAMPAGDYLDLLAALFDGPGTGERHHGQRRRWMRWTLDAFGWNEKTVKSVLAGTHIPNAPLREAVRRVKADHLASTGEPLTSTALGEAIGAQDGTHFDRLLGERPMAVSVKNGRPYGGNHIQAIARHHAEAIVCVLGLAPDEIPGL